MISSNRTALYVHSSYSSKHFPRFHDSDTSRSFTLLDSLCLQSVSRSRYHSSINENVKRLTDSVDQSVSSRNRVSLPPNFPTDILPPPSPKVLPDSFFTFAEDLATTRSAGSASIKRESRRQLYFIALPRSLQPLGSRCHCSFQTNFPSKLISLEQTRFLVGTE